MGRRKHTLNSGSSKNVHPFAKQIGCPVGGCIVADVDREVFVWVSLCSNAGQRVGEIRRGVVDWNNDGNICKGIVFGDRFWDLVGLRRRGREG